MRLALTLAAGVAASLAGCSTDAPAPAGPVESMTVIDTAAVLALTPDQRAERAEMAADAAASYRAADGARSLSDACAEANAVAMYYGEAGQRADSTRWQATADSACAAIGPEIERTLARLTDSLAAARGT